MGGREVHVPELPLADGAVVAEGNLDAPVSHLPDVDVGRIGHARRGRERRREQQVVGRAVVDVYRDIGPVLELHIEPEVHGFVLFPLQIRVAQ